MILGGLIALTATLRAAEDLPRPLAGHPGNIFLADEPVTVSLPAKAGEKWKLIDYEGKTLRKDIVPGEEAQLGKLPVGYYELRGDHAEDRITLGVIAPLVAPTPKTSPIGIDIAMAWLYPDEAQQPGVVNLCTLAGMNWVRDRMSWPELETAPGKFAPANKYDRTAAIQSDAGLRVLQVNHIGPPWLKNHKRFPDDLRDAYRFYKEIAQQLQRQGRRDRAVERTGHRCIRRAHRQRDRFDAEGKLPRHQGGQSRHDRLPERVRPFPT